MTKKYYRVLRNKLKTLGGILYSSILQTLHYYMYSTQKSQKYIIRIGILLLQRKQIFYTNKDRKFYELK